ncbi:MAG: GNAT family N-acetyltransferase [Vicingaceae bacterium]
MDNIEKKYLFKSERLGFRNWEESDIPLMTKISGDPEVMKFFPTTASPTQTAEFISRMQKMYAKNGFCYFAVDILKDNQFIGFIGLSEQNYNVEFAPFIDIGWRLDKKYWGKGFATEGAKRCLKLAFQEIDLENVKAIAPKINKPSISVMAKIGMTKQLEFQHPNLLENERLINCVCYEAHPNKSEKAVGVFNKLAHLYEEKYMDVSLYYNTFDLFCNAITPENPEILELACGPGNITKYLLQKRPDFKLLATDLAPKMIDLAKKNNPTATFKLLDSKKIKKLSKKFDAIMCGFILPYLNIEEVSNLITDASNALNPKGIIYMSTMEGDYLTSGLKKGSTGDELFMHYYLEKDLAPLLEKNNFNLLKIERIQTPNQPTKDLIIIAQLR